MNPSVASTEERDRLTVLREYCIDAALDEPALTGWYTPPVLCRDLQLIHLHQVGWYRGVC